MRKTITLAGCLLFVLTIAHWSNSSVAETNPGFARIAAGTFTMGAEPGANCLKPGPAVKYAGPHWDEAPVHRVTISRAFLFGVREVTNGEFVEFRPAHRNDVTSRGLDWDASSPAVMVTWQDAFDFCAWLSSRAGKPYRLPTEAEWEFAPGQAEKLDLQGIDNGIGEWCLDWWAPYPDGGQTDPLGPREGIVRVIRGGGARLTDRSGSVPGDRRSNVGFRVVQAPMPEGAYNPDLPVAAVFQHVSQATKSWKQADNSDVPFFAGGKVFIPEPKDPFTLPYWGRHHVPSLTWCDNGDMLATAFTAPADGSDQMAILITRLRDGKTQWDPPARFFIAPDRNVTSAVLFHAQQGELHHYNGISSTRFDDFSMIKRVSSDNGATWSVPRIVREYPAVAGSDEAWHGEPRLWPHMDILPLEDGTLLFPTDAYRYGGTAVFASRNLGESWSEWTRFGWQPEQFAKPGGQAGWIAGIHAPLVLLKDQRWFALGRSHDIDGHAPCSVSADQGKTWTFRASPFPPLKSGQRPVMRRLQEGPILLVSFANAEQGIEMTAAAGQARRIQGMFSAISLDEAKTWAHIKLIPMDASHPNQSPGGGYLSCVQTPDRMIHLLSSQRYYRFNLAWVMQPPADPGFRQK